MDEERTMTVDEAIHEVARMNVEILGMFRTAQAERVERNRQIIEMITQSESRIDRINEMVLNLTKVMADMTGTYTNHLTNLSASRDEVIRQNSRFIEVLEQIRIENVRNNQRYDDLLDRYTHLAERKSTHNDIHLK